MISFCEQADVIVSFARERVGRVAVQLAQGSNQ